MGSQPVVGHLVRGFVAPTETFIVNQIRSLRGFQPIVLCHHRLQQAPETFPVVALDQILAGRAALVDRLAYSVARQLPRASASLLATQAKSAGVSLLHFHYLVDARFFLALKWLTGLPTVVSGYGYDVSSFPRRFLGYGRHCLKLLFRGMELVLAMSQDMRQDLLALGCPDQKIRVHYHGADTGRFAFPEREYLDREEVTLLICGTLEIKKAQHLVLRALRLAEGDGLLRRRVRVELVGDGPMRRGLEEQVASYNWRDRVRFAGHIPYEGDALVQAYHRADLFALPSITVKGDKEGIPGTIVEAMASGLPVLSSTHGGIPEIIESGRDGLLVREGDLDEMARGLAELVNSSALRQRLGRVAAERAARELGLQVRTRNLERIYAELLGNL